MWFGGLPADVVFTVPEEMRKTHFESARVAARLRACEILAEIMENTYASSTFGGALGYYMNEGLLLADVHGNNVGMAAQGDEGQILPAITDPGQAVVLKREWAVVEIPELQEG